LTRGGWSRVRRGDANRATKPIERLQLACSTRSLTHRRQTSPRTQVRKALAGKCDLLIVWGGEGMVQQCINAVAGADAALAIIPAGTANLLASNLGIPKTSAPPWRSRSQAADAGSAWGESTTSTSP
jgi:diacylglycerol kinase family enzyme